MAGIRPIQPTHGVAEISALTEHFTITCLSKRPDAHTFSLKRFVCATHYSEVRNSRIFRLYPLASTLSTSDTAET